jgi:tRNA threonylcarbamoyladenosine biosynthesis protein TsaB
MIILTIRTDKPESELGLFLANNVKGPSSHIKENLTEVEDSKIIYVRGRTFHITEVVYEVWPAHRQLAETIHVKIKEILKQASKDMSDIEGVVCFQGPGSFTGLRIGLTVGNALAYALKIPIIAKEDPNWLKRGIKDLVMGKNDKIALPEYGSKPNTTKQKK